VAAAQSSTRERRAADAERDAVAAAGVLLMADRIGEVFDGSVAGVERWGYFVEFDEVFVEGVVPVSRLREYFEFIPERLELASRSSNASIRIGARVRVRLIAADLAARRLELEPA
jgi:ribonuclease R